MDPMKLRAWIAERIEEHAPDNNKHQENAVRLADAAAALRGNKSKPTIFGMQLPPEGVVDAGPLFGRCIELLHVWEQVLAPHLRAELAMLGQTLQLPLLTKPGAIRAPTTHHLQVWSPVVLDDCESDEEVIYDAPSILRSFDGVHPRQPLDLLDVPCLRTASGGDPTTASLYPIYGWATGGDVELAFDPTRSALRARFTFDLSRAPSSLELEGFLSVFREELFYSAWGMSLEWDCTPDPETISIHVEPRVEDYSLIVVPPRGAR